MPGFGARAAFWGGLLVLGLMATPGRAQVWQQQGQPPLLIELYTSEGCSSCPPADARLASLLQHPDLWRRVVPLAFHVDYWGHLGWRDPFARPAYSQRQRSLLARGRLRSLYTPAWVVDGTEWRGFFQHQPWPTPRPRTAGALRAELQGARLHVAYRAEGGSDGPRVAHLALLAFDRVSQVGAGENRGRRLPHQFVVVEQQQARGTDEWWFDLRSSIDARRALVVWLGAAQQAEPLQVVAGWLEQGVE